MPINHAIWQVKLPPSSLPIGRLASEQELEEMIVAAPQILHSQWMLIGRQEQTGLGGRIDLLAIAPDASLVLIEIKRNRTPREVVAQALDYASWVEQLTADKLAQIYQRYSGGRSLNEAFRQYFGVELDEETLNQSHQITIVASELDDSTERIIGYLNTRNIPINVVFFQVYVYESSKFLSRAWLIDPGETQANATTASMVKGEKEPWNGEFYVSFGTGQSRTWDEARSYGFISAGGGSWYVQTLKLLSPGDRVWVNNPRIGYLGVGRVVDPVVSVNDFTIKTETGEKPCLQVLSTANHLRMHADDPDKAEHFVRVEWLDTVSVDKAFNEIGLFGNQNTVCQPTTPKWRHTVDRLKSYFNKWDATL